ncbi:MAG TPA: HAMP domain-containing histidine kinase [Oscillatoriales cyanobacterium M59_W2019_021]|nr:HAMP domain-containing histidine kinase [Oscillatoriales cyanobacterium M4454_W2019_049]HIK51007.1 HAMP domain-containing histidine kinase [Oscillatoriales cyanobacterium M59_W2019_021]
MKDDLPKMLASMEVGADRIRQIVLSLRNFSRLGESQLKSVDLHDGLNSTLTFLKNRLQARKPYPHIQILSEYGDVPPVECYAGQLNQVFLVTLGRAIDAIEDAYPIAHPSLTQEPPHPVWATADVRVGVARPLDVAPPKSSPQQPPGGKIRISTHRQGDFALISIADNGLGIVEKVRRYLFDPSFAIAPKRQTKTLSLAIAHQIVVEQHGGQLKCSFHAERGNQLTIALPISQSSPPPTPCGRENCEDCDRLRC